RVGGPFPPPARAPRGAAPPPADIPPRPARIVISAACPAPGTVMPSTPTMPAIAAVAAVLMVSSRSLFVVDCSLRGSPRYLLPDLDLTAATSASNVPGK